MHVDRLQAGRPACVHDPATEPDPSVQAGGQASPTAQPARSGGIVRLAQVEGRSPRVRSSPGGTPSPAVPYHESGRDIANLPPDDDGQISHSARRLPSTRRAWRNDWRNPGKIVKPRDGGLHSRGKLTPMPERTDTGGDCGASATFRMAAGRESSALRSGPGSGSTPRTRMPGKKSPAGPLSLARSPAASERAPEQLAKPGKTASCRGIMCRCQKDRPLAEIAGLP
jgi:hypothetical protein